MERLPVLTHEFTTESTAESPRSLSLEPPREDCSFVDELLGMPLRDLPDVSLQELDDQLQEVAAAGALLDAHCDAAWAEPLPDLWTNAESSVLERLAKRRRVRPARPEPPIPFDVREALRRMVAANDVAAVKEMLAAGGWGDEPLYFYSRSVRMSHALFEAGVLLHTTDSRGRTAFYDMPYLHFRGLEAHMDLESEDMEGNTLLMHSVMYDHHCDMERIGALLRAGANPNHPNKTGRTPLFYVRTVNTAKLLLSRRANPQLVDRFGNSVLMINRQVAVLRHLLQHYRMDVNARNEDGNTALFTQDDRDVVQLLLDAGADIDVTNWSGESIVTHMVRRTPLLARLHEIYLQSQGPAADAQPAAAPTTAPSPAE